MKLIVKTFHNFFLSKLFNILKFLGLFLIIVVFNNSLFANNESKETSILNRLPTSIFATVNGEVISVYDLILRSNLFSASSNIEIDEFFNTNILPDLISGLIDETIQSQEIEKNNIIVPKNQIDGMISNIEKENGIEPNKLQDFLKEKNSDIKILEKQISTNIGWRQLIANKFRTQVIIEESDISMVLDNLKKSKGKEEYLIEQIFISFENREEKDSYQRIQNVYDQIQKGADFLSVANQFSDTFSGKVGKIGWVSETELDSQLVDEIKKLEIDLISNIIKGENGYYIINLKDKRIIGKDKIDKVSIFQIELIDESPEIISELNQINDCSSLEKFSNKNGTANSGSLGYIKFNELSEELKSKIKKLEINKISDPINDYRVMICDVKKITPTFPSKFKIEEVLLSRKLDTIARQYLSELRAKAVIDLKI